MLSAEQFDQLKRDLLAHSDRRTIEYLAKVFAVALQLLKQQWPQESDRHICEVLDQIGGAAILCLRDEYLKIQSPQREPASKGVPCQRIH